MSENIKRLKTFTRENAFCGLDENPRLKKYIENQKRIEGKIILKLMNIYNNYQGAKKTYRQKT